MAIGLMLGLAGTAHANIEYSRLVGRGCSTCHMDTRTPAKDTVLPAGVSFSDCRLDQVCINQWKASLPPETRPGSTARAAAQDWSSQPPAPAPVVPQFVPPPYSPFPHWAPWGKVQAIPSDALRGATEGASTPEYICRATYGGGVHPGKVVGGTCFFAYFNKEIGVGLYDLLFGAPDKVFWAAPGSNNGAELVPGGREDTRILPICRVRLFVAGRLIGVEIGKETGGKCEVGYGGAAYHQDGFELLYQTAGVPSPAYQPPVSSPSR